MTFASWPDRSDVVSTAWLDLGLLLLLLLLETDDVVVVVVVVVVAQGLQKIIPWRMRHKVVYGMYLFIQKRSANIKPDSDQVVIS